LQAQGADRAEQAGREQLYPRDAAPLPVKGKVVSFCRLRFPIGRLAPLALMTKSLPEWRVSDRGPSNWPEQICGMRVDWWKNVAVMEQSGD